LFDNYDPGETHPASDIRVLPFGGRQRAYYRHHSRNGRDDFTNGRWVAHVADDTGTAQVYVQAFPATSQRWRVSIAERTIRSGARDGRELLLVSADDGSQPSE
jgi:hypothetical protein